MSSGTVAEEGETKLNVACPAWPTDVDLEKQVRCNSVTANDCEKAMDYTGLQQQMEREGYCSPSAVKDQEFCGGVASIAVLKHQQRYLREQQKANPMQWSEFQCAEIVENLCERLQETSEWQLQQQEAMHSKQLEILETLLDRIVTPASDEKVRGGSLLDDFFCHGVGTNRMRTGAAETIATVSTSQAKSASGRKPLPAIGSASSNRVPLSPPPSIFSHRDVSNV